tara:strand:+ start:540 stop:695 length:156 start_codon:yes stop_codon:yes gene_type:complete
VIKLKKQLRKVSYLEFKLNKELAHENTFGKDEKIQKEYEKYLEEKEEEKST